MNQIPDPTGAGAPAPPPPSPPPQDPGPRRFLRSRDDRVLGGVAGGLGRTFGIDPVLFRIVFVALVFVGGVGVLLYVLALLVTPSDDGTGRPRAGDHTGRRLIRATAFAGVALAALCAVLLAVALAAWAAAAGGAWAVAAIVIALGLALVAAAFRGGARWLVLPALLVALPAGVVSAADLDLDGGVGQRTYRPAAMADVTGGYRIGVGELVVDLRNLDWQDGARVGLPIDVGVGHAIVLVPRDVCVIGAADIGLGAVDILGRDVGGVDTDWQTGDTRRGDNPRLVLDASLGVGEVEVRHTRLDRFERGPDGGFGDDLDLVDGLRARERAAADAACEGATA